MRDRWAYLAAAKVDRSLYSYSHVHVIDCIYRPTFCIKETDEIPALPLHVHNREIQQAP
jgi:hypothetical protein